MDFIVRIFHALTQLHPPHTVVVHFPIALTGAALFFILLALWKRSKILEQVAFANISLAAASTIVAAFFGIRDNIVFYNSGAPIILQKSSWRARCLSLLLSRRLRGGGRRTFFIPSLPRRFMLRHIL